MKRWICLLLFLPMILCGCAGAPVEEATASSTPAAEPAATETFAEVPVISQEMAMIEGYVVMDDGDVRHNVKSWMDFLEQCEAGNSASVSVASFSQGESGYAYVKYDLTFDGSVYTVEYYNGQEIVRDSSAELTYSAGLLESSEEPYDSYERYDLNGLILYQDLIAEPDFEGVTEIFLHAKEGEPALRSYSGDTLQPVLELLWNAEYLSCEPADYMYCMKLIMENRNGKELVIELDYRYGNFRYGMQTYHYGQLTDLFAVLQIQQWPESVIEEFDAYINGEFQENLNS